MNQVTVTTQGFVGFVNNQPADKVINHKDWVSCATGEYIDSQGGISKETVEVKRWGEYTYPPKNYRSIESASREMTSDIVVKHSELIDEEVLLRSILNYPFKAELYTPTYGDLQELIKGAQINDCSYTVDLRHHDDIEYNS